MLHHLQQLSFYTIVKHHGVWSISSEVPYICFLTMLFLICYFSKFIVTSILFLVDDVIDDVITNVLAWRLLHRWLLHISHWAVRCLISKSEYIFISNSDRKKNTLCNTRNASHQDVTVHSDFCCIALHVFCFCLDHCILFYLSFFVTRWSLFPDSQSFSLLCFLYIFSFLPLIFYRDSKFFFGRVFILFFN